MAEEILIPQKRVQIAEALNECMLSCSLGREAEPGWHFTSHVVDVDNVWLHVYGNNLDAKIQLMDEQLLSLRDQAVNGMKSCIENLGSGEGEENG